MHPRAPGSSLRQWPRSCPACRRRGASAPASPAGPSPSPEPPPAAPPRRPRRPWPPPGRRPRRPRPRPPRRPPRRPSARPSSPARTVWRPPGRPACGRRSRPGAPPGRRRGASCRSSAPRQRQSRSQCSRGSTATTARPAGTPPPPPPRPQAPGARAWVASTGGGPPRRGSRSGRSMTPPCSLPAPCRASTPSLPMRWCSRCTGCQRHRCPIRPRDLCKPTVPPCTSGQRRPTPPNVRQQTQSLDYSSCRQSP
mmetsp:Transcript_95077/g.293109  ORF Transcript_95077/g.293109 Transcript_95077/m.293109 type:complete len:253 (+) Transcript_95077:965-1723(+)